MCCLVLADLAVSLFLSAGSVGAEASDNETLAPYFFVQSEDPSVDRLPLKSTQVRATVTGMIAIVRVVQTYRNDGTRPIHAQYVFPASTRAAVHGLTLQVGERRIEAEVHEKSAARAIFEAAQSNGQRAALLDQERPNVFRMNVANIVPGDEVKVKHK